MKFTFRLERLKRLRKTEEEIAQRDYSEALGRYEDQARLLESMYSDLDKTRESRATSIKQGGAISSELVSMDFYLIGQEAKIAGQRQILRGLKEILEQKHEILVEKVKAHKSLEKLKEKKKREFVLEGKKKLQKQSDDSVTMSYRNLSEDEATNG